MNKEPGDSGEAPRYAMATIDSVSERARLQSLQALNDAASLRRIDAVGVTSGWRCVEIGAGAGSIAVALSERVGDGGYVVASDRDPRFLDEFAGPGRHVLTHDISSGPVPPGNFDFAHCRAVLAHVADLSGTVRHVMASVRPGGWVMCEEADYGSLEPCDPDHPRSSYFDTFRLIMTEAGLLDSFAGRNTHQALRDAGLVDITTDLNSSIAVGGSLRAQYRVHSMQRVQSRILDSGFCSEAAFARMLEVFADPSFEYIDNSWIATWGRTPE